MKKFRKTVDKGIAYFKRNGAGGFVRRLIRKIELLRPVNYPEWLKKHSAPRKELAWQRTHIPDGFPKIGVYIAGDGDQVAYGKTVDSLEKQSYQGFELYTPAQKVSGKYLLILKAGTLAEPDMLYTFASAIQKYPQGELLYSDHDELREGVRGTCNPQCKPEFDLYYLRSRNYIGDAFMVSAALAGRIGLPDEKKRDAVFYDYLLRCAEKTQQVIRIPRILFHELPGQRNVQEEKMALEEHYCRLSIPAKVKIQKEDGIYAAEYQYKDAPLVSVIIPNKDNEEQLLECVESILKEGGYDNLEILIVENNSEQESTFRCYEELQKKDSRVRVMVWQGSFQYSKMNNDAAREAKGEYLLFLNNDTKVKRPGCLAEMMNVGRCPDVGAVGAGLYYGDHTIQHAGVVIGYGGVAGHAFEGMPEEQYKKLPFASAHRQVSAVTAACMLVRREAFEAAGGFCEELKVAYNDVDLCLSIREKGWKVIYCPQAELYHYESQTRGLEMTTEKAKRVLGEQAFFQKKWQKQLKAGDSCYNPNLTLESSDFSLKR